MRCVWCCKWFARFRRSACQLRSGKWVCSAECWDAYVAVLDDPLNQIILGQGSNE